MSQATPLLTDLLKQVSRSFYKTLRVLPGAVRPQIGLAYLLARITDTIADTELVSVERRLSALRLFRDRVLDLRQERLDFGTLAAQQGAAAEKILLERAEESLAILQSFSEIDRRLIREVLSTIASGQELDLVRFGSASKDNISILGTDPELDDYTYRVAGCVGEFWTKICQRHLFPGAVLDEERLLANAVRFGKGLQLVNILRDLPNDLRQGRCYLPADCLAQAGLTPAELLHPKAELKFRPLYNSYLALTLSHLEAGWDYTNSLPWVALRVRLACAWPILIGVRTVNRLRVSNVLDASQRVKITRSEVRHIILQTAGLYLFPRCWRTLFAQTVSAEPIASSLAVCSPENAVSKTV